MYSHQFYSLRFAISTAAGSAAIVSTTAELPMHSQAKQIGADRRAETGMETKSKPKFSNTTLGTSRTWLAWFVFDAAPSNKTFQEFCECLQSYNALWIRTSSLCPFTIICKRTQCVRYSQPCHRSVSLRTIQKWPFLFNKRIDKQKNSKHTHTHTHKCHAQKMFDWVDLCVLLVKYIPLCLTSNELSCSRSHLV